MKIFLRALAALGLSAFTGLAAAVDVAPYSAVAAPDWTALFDRRSGWTGADGVYSIPLSADERPGSAQSTKTLILFSDTFVGKVRADGSRKDTVMVNNTTALLTGGEPLAERLQFNVRSDPRSGDAVSMVVPKAARYPGEWFWPADGIMTGGQVVFYALRVKSANTPPFAFATAGASLLSANASDPVPFLGRYTQKDAPLFLPPGPNGTGEVFFGLAAMPLTVAAGAPFPDGYLYVYGTRSNRYVKSMLVARVAPERIHDFSAYRFWNGSDWVPEIAASKAVTHGVSAEFSVIPLPDGRYLLIHMTDLLGHTVAVRYGASPVGPWGEDIPVWDCPEIALTPNVFVYGAKAHPHLSTPGELLISYHVNTFDFVENFEPGGVDIYRPRFLRLPLP